MKFFAIFLSALVGTTIALPAAERNGEVYDPTLDYDDNYNWRVVGGSAVSSPTTYPYMVSLRRGASHFCGASILSNVWILSAAHCTVGQSPASITAVVGTITLNSGGTRYAIARIVNHGSHNPTTVANDISLLRTSSSIAFNNNVRSISISSTNVGAGQGAVLTGWGGTVAGGSTPNNLQQITLQTITVNDCTSRLSPNPVFATSLCTLTRTGQGACNGDSGGPLAVGNAQIGVVSWGIPCARGFPDVFARVSSYVGWIQANAN